METQEKYFTELEDHEEEECICIRTEVQGDIIRNLENQVKELLCEDMDKKTLKDNQLKIIKYYGADKQLRQLTEECGELIVAISKLQRGAESLNIRSKVPSKLLNDLIYEIADVENLIEQIKLDHDLVNEGVVRVKEYKVNRQLDRIRRKTDGE